MNITLWSFVAPSGFDSGCLLALSSRERQEEWMRAYIFVIYCIHLSFLALAGPRPIGDHSKVGRLRVGVGDLDSPGSETTSQ
jgi:hypothetical protein